MLAIKCSSLELTLVLSSPIPLIKSHQIVPPNSEGPGNAILPEGSRIRNTEQTVLMTVITSEERMLLCSSKNGILELSLLVTEILQLVLFSKNGTISPQPLLLWEKDQPLLLLSISYPTVAQFHGTISSPNEQSGNRNLF